jgi:hypothetical protein
VRVRVRVQG